jgi:transcriptional regulator with GAF, ATPase, and Fis domain/tetratricopeptide (TPR) repeat protein
MKNELGFTSRYAIKKALGAYPPWQGFGVTDSLSGKDYLLFSLSVPAGTTISIDDLLMRDYLFADVADGNSRALSIQDNGGGLFFLLPWQEIAPVTKMLPSLVPSESLKMIRSLTATFLECASTGRFFHNLSIESIVIAGGGAVILPSAYLIPEDVLDRLDASSCAAGGDNLFADLADFGKVLSHFCRYIPKKEAGSCAETAEMLMSASSDKGDMLFTMSERLASLAGREGGPPALLAGRRPPARNHTAAMNLIRQAAFRSRDDGKQMVILSGRAGDGKTSLLETTARRLTGEWGFKGNGIAGDQSVFGDMPESEEGDDAEFTLHDDHHQGPVLSGLIVDRLSHDLEKARFAVIGLSDDAPAWFSDAVRSEGRERGFTITDVDIGSSDFAAKSRSVLKLLPRERRAGVRKTFNRGDSFAVMELKARLGAEAQAAEGGQGNVIDLMTDEERAVLSFIAVFRFDVPLSILKDVFSTEEGRFYLILHRLVTLGVIRKRARSSCFAHGDLCTLFSVSGKSIASMVEDSIDPERRVQLHRNIAGILKETQGVPAVYMFYHLVRAGDMEEAAFRGLRVFQLLLNRKRLNAINSFNDGFMSLGLDGHLPIEMRLKLLLELGNYYSNIGRIEKAEDFFRCCREETSTSDRWQSHRELAVEAIRKESEILEKRGEFVIAEELLKKALQTHGEHVLARERAKLYNDLAWVYYRIGKFDSSWENCMLVQKLLDKKQHPMELAQSYNLMGAINWNRSKYDEALLCHKKCLALREDVNDELGVAASLNNLGLVYRSMGRMKEALESFTKSMRIKQRNDNRPGLAAVHLNIALACLDTEELEKADANCRTAVKLAEDLGNQQLLAEIYGTLGEIRFAKGDNVEARNHYFRALHICQKTRSLREKAVVLRRIGELDLAEGRLEETRELLSEARELNGEIGSRLETALLDLLDGRLLLAEGKREQGRRILEETSFELSLLGRKGTAASVASEIGELYLEEGNEPLAREYLLRAISLFGESDRLPKRVARLQKHLEQRATLDLDTIHSDSTRFRALCRVISLIRTTHDPERLHHAIAETAMRMTGMERAALILQSDGQDTYRILASIGDLDSESILTDKNIITILNIARQLGYPLDISRTRIPAGKVQAEFLADHPGIICTPLWIHDEVTGYLYLDTSREDVGASDDEHTFLVAFSQQVALGLERILLSDRLRRKEQAAGENVSVIGSPGERVTFQDIIGKSAAIRKIYDLIDGIKDMDTAVLLTGPNGAGKDLIAKTIHYTSPRKDKPFHTLNCPALPDQLIESELFGHEKGSFTGAYKQNIGHFESASDGTIFLNEIGDLPLKLQPKLLRVLEDRRFFRVGGTREIKTNARVIFATNQDLIRLVKEGRFREDLYYRINIFPIRVPGLVERREDIKLLCNHFLTMYCRLYNTPTKRISPEAMAYLTEYDWPGNVRELENTINRLIIISRKDTILPEDLPANIVKHRESVETRSLSTLEEMIDSMLDSIEFSGSDPILPRVKETLISKVVEKTGDKTKAAQILGISKPTLYSHLRNHERKRR